MTDRRDKTVPHVTSEEANSMERAVPARLPSSRKIEANEEVLRLMRAL